MISTNAKKLSKKIHMTSYTMKILKSITCIFDAFFDNSFQLIIKIYQSIFVPENIGLLQQIIEQAMGLLMGRDLSSTGVKGT